MISLRTEPINPFLPFIFKAHYDFNWSVLKPVCKHLIDTTEKEMYLVENGQSSHMNSRQPHLMPQFKPFYDWLNKMVKDAVDKAGYTKFYPYTIGNSWVNYHGEGGKTLEHNHQNTTLVCAAYLYMPKNGGYIQFKDPLEYHKATVQHEDVKAWYWKDVPTITGDVIIFPGWLKHRTHPNSSSEKRWVLTTNLFQDPNLSGKF
jgi:uncharacterized protein (TIGR02466 family)